MTSHLAAESRCKRSIETTSAKELASTFESPGAAQIRPGLMKKHQYLKWIDEESLCVLVSVCLCVCVFACLRACARRGARACPRACARARACACVYVRLRACACACACACTCACACVCVCACVNVGTVNLYVHMHIYIYIIYVCVCARCCFDDLYNSPLIIVRYIEMLLFQPAYSVCVYSDPDVECPCRF